MAKKQANRFPQNPVTIATPPREGSSFKSDGKGKFERLDKPQEPPIPSSERRRAEEAKEASTKKASKKKASKKKASKKKASKKKASKKKSATTSTANNNVTPLRPDGETKE